MELETRSVFDKDKDDYNILIYGDSGVGKTHLVATAQNCQETAPLLYINFEGGEETLKNVDKGGEIEVYDINRWADFNTVYQYLKNGGIEKFNAVALDTLTEIQELAMDFILNDEIEDLKLDTDVSTPLIGDWGDNIALMKKLIRAFRDLDIVVFYVAHQMRDKDEDTGMISITPSFSGKKLPNQACGMMDIVAQMITYQDDGEAKRAIKVVPTGKEIAKDRTNSMGKGLKENPTVSDMFEKIKGKDDN